MKGTQNNTNKMSAMARLLISKFVVDLIDGFTAITGIGSTNCYQ